MCQEPLVIFACGSKTCNGGMTFAELLGLYDKGPEDALLCKARRAGLQDTQIIMNSSDLVGGDTRIAYSGGP